MRRSPERQRQKWFQHTEDVWLDWIDRLPVGGFGRYPKAKWMAWSDSMIRTDDQEAQTWGAAAQPGEMIRLLENCFTEAECDADAISSASGCSAESITADPPANAKDFAIKYLAGAFAVREAPAWSAAA